MDRFRSLGHSVPVSACCIKLYQVLRDFSWWEALKLVFGSQNGNAPLRSLTYTDEYSSKPFHSLDYSTVTLCRRSKTGTSADSSSAPKCSCISACILDLVLDSGSPFNFHGRSLSLCQLLNFSYSWPCLSQSRRSIVFVTLTPQFSSRNSEVSEASPIHLDTKRPLISTY